MPQQQHIHITALQYAADELTAADRSLLEAARKACEKAYAPYSNFWVGAAIRLSSGEVIEGANQENAAYPSGLCAERTAAYWAGANRSGHAMEAIAVTARKASVEKFLSVTPCGSCRQALLEYEVNQKSPIRVILETGDGGCLVFDSVESLLPMKFSEKNLK